MSTHFQYVVYKITFPNGKIYVGKDIGFGGHSIRYFGTWNRALVESDFSKAELEDFTLRKEILFESNDKLKVGRKEMALIVQFGANDPLKGIIGLRSSGKYRVESVGECNPPPPQTSRPVTRLRHLRTANTVRTSTINTGIPITR